MAESPIPPNIIFLLSDDMSWSDMGCFGQTQIDTPNLDALCEGGMKLTGCHAGAPVCAPSRSGLMQGLHLGHATVRSNYANHPHGGYRHSLQQGDVTMAHLFQQAGYTTGMFGKWGLGLTDQEGIPENMGFDQFFGYLNQRKAHNYFPEYLWSNNIRVDLPENKGHNHKADRSYDAEGNLIVNGVPDTTKASYSFDLCEQASLNFVRENHHQPFFLYLPVTTPHGMFEVPNLLQYKDRDWPEAAQAYAAMMTHLDNSVGTLVELLKELDLFENTLFVFASDNGYSHSAHPELEETFQHTGPYRGSKGNLLQGGVRVPAFAVWPGHIPAGSTSAHPWAFYDLLPTLCEAVDINVPEGLDGVSILPTLLGKPEEQTEHAFFYWQYHHQQAVRKGPHYFYRKHPNSPIEMYDADGDPQQEHDLAGEHSDAVSDVEALFESEHTESLYFYSPGESKESWWARLDEAGLTLPNNVDR